MGAKVLLIDDDRTVRLLVERGLGGSGFDVRSAATGEEGLRLMDQEQPDVALIDVYLPEMNGLELYKKLRALDRKLPIIFITGDSSSETTIEAMRLGAFDYLAKPLNLEKLRELTVSAAESRRLMDEPVAMPLGAPTKGGEQFIGRSPAMSGVFKAIGRVAEQNVTVLVRGESGCGKELVARAIFEHSPRRDKPFVAVNCAAIPDQLLESELFGVEKGAYTGADRRRAGKFEHCDGGTIFLDEIGEMSAPMQAKILQVLQDGEFSRLGGTQDTRVDVRIIAATHRDLDSMIGEGQFREDLFFRLNVISITLPSLRERPDSIPLIADHFLRKYSETYKRPYVPIASSMLEKFMEYSWPGNIREMENLVQRMVILGVEASSREILQTLSAPSVRRSLSAGGAKSQPPAPAGNGHQQRPSSSDGYPDKAQTVRQSINGAGKERLGSLKDAARVAAQQVECDLILESLRRMRWNRKETAKLLGVSYKTLLAKIRENGLDDEVPDADSLQNVG